MDTHPQSLAETLGCLIGNLRSISLNPLFLPVMLVKSILIWGWGSSSSKELSDLLLFGTHTTIES